MTQASQSESGSRKLFISHINEEAPLATVLKEWLEDSFPGICEVFVSSDPDDLPAGTKWLEHIDQALDEARVLLVLCSRTSLHRPWVNFEAGCAWRQRIAIIPICHSDLDIDDLPAPLGEFHALKLEHGEFVQKLMRGVARQLGLDRYPKRVNSQAMAKALLNAQHTITLARDSGRKVTGETLRLSGDALHVLEKVVEAGNAGIFDSSLKESVSIAESRLTYHLERLTDWGLIIGELVRETPKGREAKWRYWATPDGRRMLFGFRA